MIVREKIVIRDACELLLAITNDDFFFNSTPTFWTFFWISGWGVTVRRTSVRTIAVP